MTTRLKKSLLFGMFILCVILLIMTDHVKAIELSARYGEAVWTISKEKEVCEGLVSTLKSEYSEKSREFNEGRLLYGDTRAAFNGWIDALKFCLSKCDDLFKSEEYYKTLNDAIDKNEKFKKYVKGLEHKYYEGILDCRGCHPVEYEKLEESKKDFTYFDLFNSIKKLSEGFFDFRIRLISEFSKIGFEIWDRYRISKEKEKKEIEKTLENLKWKHFDEIKTIRFFPLDSLPFPSD